MVMTQKMSWCVEWVVGEKFRARKAREGNAPDEGPFFRRDDEQRARDMEK